MCVMQKGLCTSHLNNIEIRCDDADCGGGGKLSHMLCMASE